MSQNEKDTIRKISDNIKRRKGNGEVSTGNSEPQTTNNQIDDEKRKTAYDKLIEENKPKSL